MSSDVDKLRLELTVERARNRGLEDRIIKLLLGVIEAERARGRELTERIAELEEKVADPGVVTPTERRMKRLARDVRKVLTRPR